MFRNTEIRKLLQNTRQLMGDQSFFRDQKENAFPWCLCVRSLVGHLRRHFPNQKNRNESLARSCIQVGNDSSATRGSVEIQLALTNRHTPSLLIHQILHLLHLRTPRYHPPSTCHFRHMPIHTLPLESDF